MNLEINSSNTDAEGEINLNKCERVKTCIDSYFSMNPRLTLQSVEDKTSVPYSTLRRIMLLNGNPQPESVIKIFQALGYDQELYQYMSDFHPDIASVMAMKTSHNIEYSYIKDEDREYFVSEDYYLIINLAYSTSGTSHEEVAHVLGTKGVERLEELVKRHLVIKNDLGKYIGAVGNYKLSFADTKKGIEMALRYYRLEEAGSINNWLSFQTESLNTEGLKALKALQQKHFNERKEEILNNPVYNGDLKVYSATVSSTFLSYSELGDLQ
ncbi:MAG: hypothetical protein Q7U04_06955 [Bacteriovorax sp.]|nr:hypothetical protein [Bacteriovorax sp.]